MLSAAWGSNGESTVARHEWKGLTKLGNKLEDWVEKNRAEGEERRIAARTLPGAYHHSEESEYIATSDEESE